MANSMISVLSTDSKVAPSKSLSSALHSDDASELLGTAPNLRFLIDALVEGGHADDALRCITSQLPKGHVLLWGVSIMRECVRNPESHVVEADRVGLALVDRWLSDSKEESRLAAQQFSESDEFSNPGGWLAAAAGWMTGSLTPADCPAVPPPSSLPGEAVAACLVTLASRQPERREALLEAWVQDGLRFFGGGGRPS